MSANAEQRKLAAIMFTDMVGYSALAQRDDKLALELLEEHRQLLREIFPRFNGTEIKTIGDAFLVEFNSALEAAQCAIEIQRALAKHNADVPPDRRIEVKIGIHIGDVVHRGGDVYGDGVNIASRIERLAGPGGICVSMDVERQIRNALEARFERLAPTELKNISVAMDLFRIVLPWEQQPALSTSSRMLPEARSNKGKWIAATVIFLLIIGIGWWWSTLSRKAVTLRPASDELRRGQQSEAATAIPEKSIAVLPFESLSEDKSNAYFADGIQDQILARLSKIAELKVISRTSTQKYKSAPDNLREIAKQLGVANILEGSVQKAGDQVRITVQLINALKDNHLWADTYDRSMSNIFGVESDVSQKIAESLEAKLTGREKKEIAVAGTINPEAYDAYLHGVALRGSQRLEDTEKQLDFLRRAVELDSNYAQAWAMLGMAEAEYYFFPDRSEARKTRAREAVETALRLAPDLPQARAAMGVFDYHCLQDYDAAIAQLNIAHESAPNDAQILSYIGFVRRRQGKLDDCIGALRQAAILDPLNTDVVVNLGRSYRGMRKFGEARTLFDRALTIAPGEVNPLCLKGETYIAEGDINTAWQIVSELKASPGESGIDVHIKLLLFRRQFDQLTTLISSIASAKNVPPVIIATAHAALGSLHLLKGDRAEALALCEQAEREAKTLRAEGAGPLGGVLIELEGRLGRRAQVEEEVKILFERTRKDKWEFPNSETSAAIGYTLLGDFDRALPLLQDALTQPSEESLTPGYLRLNPVWDPIRNDPRFQKLCQDNQP